MDNISLKRWDKDFETWGSDASQEEMKVWIASHLATTFSDDKEFLRKINKLCFGLMSGE
jgi:hypothetical protein